MTPFELEILMHHHVCPRPFQRQSELYEAIVRGFVASGILTDSLETTELGRAWISLILDIPIPQKKTVFVDQYNNIIDI